MLAALLLTAALSAASGAAPARTCAYTAGADTISVSGHPFTALPSPDGCWLFVSLSGEGGAQSGLAILNNQDGRFLLSRTIQTRDIVYGLALTHDGGVLLAATGNDLRAFDVRRLEVGLVDAELGRIPQGQGTQPIYVATSKDDHLAFVSDERAEEITVVDLREALSAGFGRTAVVGHIPQGRAPVGLALSPDGTRLYATSESMKGGSAFAKRCRSEKTVNTADHPEGALSVIDVAKAASDPAHALLAAVPSGCNPVRVALSSDGQTAWVTARGEDAVYAIRFADPAKPGAARRERFAVGDSPVGVTVQPGSERIWISNSNRFGTGAGDVQSLSANGEAPIHLPSGRFPRDLTFLPDGRTLVVAVFGSKSVQLIPAS